MTRPIVAFDTNILVAGLLSWHVHHAAARGVLVASLGRKPQPVVPVQVLVEAWAVMTRLPSPHGVSAADAAALLDGALRDRCRLASLNADEGWPLFDALRDGAFAGGLAYDLHILACAGAAGATRFYTFNVRDFERLHVDDVEVVAREPSTHGQRYGLAALLVFPKIEHRALWIAQEQPRVSREVPGMCGRAVPRPIVRRRAGEQAVAAATAMALRLNGIAHWIMWEMSNLFEQIGTVQDGISTLSRPIAINDAADAQPLKVTRGEIRFDDVSFAYGSDKRVIEHLALTIRPGEKIGLVGRSGAGKSTLVNLLLRFFELEDGRILIDGQDISQVTQESLRTQISVVTQDTSLLHRSIRDNIRYGRPSASDEEVIAAAKLAQAHDFILGLEDWRHRRGYDDRAHRDDGPG